MQAEIVGHALGYVGTIAFFLQYVPQIHLNYKRRSCKGFSDIAILVKLIGASFMFANLLLDTPPAPRSVTSYALVNILQYSTLILQFCAYEGGGLWTASYFLSIPISLLLSFLVPGIRSATQFMKPATQIVSHLFILQTCWRTRTTRGVSMLSQHFNLVGGASGLIMCLLLNQKFSTTMLYVNSLFQALSVYLMRAYLDR